MMIAVILERNARGMKEYKIGIDIGGTKILGIVVDAENKIIRECQYPTFHESGTLNWKQALYEAVGELSSEVSGRVQHISIACAGLIDTKMGTIIYSQSLGVHQFNLAEELSYHFSIPVSVYNDADAAAWAEKEFYQSESLLYISVGTSIGSGLIINGNVFKAGGMAGELGHVPVEHEGRPCPCGNSGCVRAYASGKAIEQEANQWQRKHQQPILLMPQILSAAGEGHPYYEKLLQGAASRLAQAAIGAVHLLNPSIIVFGGGLMENSPLYFNYTKKAIYGGLLSGFSDDLKIETSYWKEKSAALGSVYLV